ncbi:MAG: hypothetical protein CVU43_07365 [Chloroflexi bacterium HGW-Chloroflexi-5]|jgi:hypothetical protein|nr:MAG: hypothetical protein CVU43_07365 [Chloroflexi bacterium HGW-Chloroflexi-5]
MKRIALIIFIGLFLMGCSLPFTINWNTPPTQQIETPEQINATETVDVIATEPPAAPTAAPLNGIEMNLGGIYMVLPPCMAANATGTFVPAAPYDEFNGPMEYYPENRKIAFLGYPLSGGFFEANGSDHGGLTIYPIADFVAMNQAAISPIVTNMQILLADKPAAPQSIPFLPVFNAAQVFKAQVKYLDFQNGQGVRFLTEYAQYYAPVNNDDLFYAYQGITADGKYWVSAILPINAAYLQAAYDSVNVPDGGIPAPALDDPNYGNAMEAYYIVMLDKLNTTPDASFTPGLDCLDQFIQSLQISD